MRRARRRLNESRAPGGEGRGKVEGAGGREQPTREAVCVQGVSGRTRATRRMDVPVSGRTAHVMPTFSRVGRLAGLEKTKTLHLCDALRHLAFRFHLLVRGVSRSGTYPARMQYEQAGCDGSAATGHTGRTRNAERSTTAQEEDQASPGASEARRERSAWSMDHVGCHIDINKYRMS
jgi:hypothetical protein